MRLLAVNINTSKYTPIRLKNFILKQQKKYMPRFFKSIPFPNLDIKSLINLKSWKTPGKKIKEESLYGIWSF